MVISLPVIGPGGGGECLTVQGCFYRTFIHTLHVLSSRVSAFPMKGVLLTELATHGPGAAPVTSPRVRRLRSVWTFL